MAFAFNYDKTVARVYSEEECYQSSQTTDGWRKAVICNNLYIFTKAQRALSTDGATFEIPGNTAVTAKLYLPEDLVDEYSTAGDVEDACSIQISPADSAKKFQQGSPTLVYSEVTTKVYYEDGEQHLGYVQKDETDGRFYVVLHIENNTSTSAYFPVVDTLVINIRAEEPPTPPSMG